MRIILAENLDGWLWAILMLAAALGTTVLALGGLAPAFLAKRALTVGLITPAFLVGVGATWSLTSSYYKVGVFDHDHLVLNLLQPWVLMAGVPFAACVITGSVLFYKTLKRH
jgi:hypothetical protein